MFSMDELILTFQWGKSAMYEGRFNFVLLLSELIAIGSLSRYGPQSFEK
jgi:hypothetical protein